MRIATATLLLVGFGFSLGCSSTGPAPPPPAPRSPGTGAPSDKPPMPAPTPVPPPPTVAPIAPTPTSAAPEAVAPVTPPSSSPPPAAAVPPQTAPPPPAPRPAYDILRLKQAGFSDEFLLNKIRTEGVNYQLTTAEILELKTAGLSETVLEAMLRSGQSSTAAGVPVARRVEFNGLARVGKGFLVFGTSTKYTGRLVVEGDNVAWYDSDPKKNFSIYAKNIKEIFNTCLLRPGQNLCLELGLVTYTGEEYRFRDPGWKNGDNRLITEATTYFRQAFPYLFFSQRAVNEL